MQTHIALLRAVNVGGTGKLPMAELKTMCLELGFEAPRTYIASGNLVFRSDLSPEEAAAKLDARLADYAGKPVGVIMRTPAEMAEVLQNNPFPDLPGNRATVLFLNTGTPTGDDGDIRNRTDERIHFAEREIYIGFPEGQADSKLILPAMKAGTARNMNTVTKLVEMTKD